MNILITTQILDGNLGDGWADNWEAACGLAEYTERQWLTDLASYVIAGHTVEIEIDTQRNTSGCSRDVSVFVDGTDPESGDDTEREILSVLTDEKRIWEKYCASPEAEQYFGE